MGATIWAGKGQTGRAASLEDRTYYVSDLKRLIGRDYIQSLHVADETKATIFHNGDATGQHAGDTVILYPDHYGDLWDYMGTPVHAIKLEAAKGVFHAECVSACVNTDGSGAHYPLPVGEHSAATNNFHSDMMSRLDIPEGVHVEVGNYVGRDLQKRTIYGPGTIMLGDYGLNDCVDWIKVSKDGFEFVRNEYSPPEQAKPDGVIANLVQSIDNRNGKVPLTGSLNFSESVEESIERSWQSDTSLAVGVEVGTGEGSPVSAKLSVTLTQSFSVGKAKTESHSYTVEQSAEATCPPGIEQKYQLTIARMKALVHGVAVLRNKTSGREIRLPFTDTAKFAQAGTVRAV